MATAYWEHRAALRQAAYDRANNKVVKTVSRAYDRTMRQLDKDIDTIMATYTRKTGLSTREAYDFLREGVPQSVMDELRARAAAITDKAQAKQLGVMLRTDAYRARISRLDAIKASTRVGLTEAADAELRAIEPHLRHTADLAYNRSLYDIQHATSIGFQMVGVPRRTLDTILKSKWAGTHYSTSVWQNRDAMASILDRALMEQASMGKLSQITFDNVRGIVDSKAWADKVAAGMKSKFKSEMQYSKYAANRLIRTESAYVAGQTTAVAYDECGIEKYEYMATLDSRTSEKCSGLDGKIFDLKDKEVGVNWPPLHPFCRSSTACVIDGLTREGLTRAARDANGKSVYVPRDMKYQEWQAWQKDGAPADVAAWRENKPMTIESRKEIYGSFRDKLTSSGFSNETINRMSESLEMLPDAKLKMIGNTIGDANLYETENSKSFHRGGNIYIEKVMPIDGETPAAYAERVKSMTGTFYHEYGHYLDDRYGIAYDTDIMPAAENGANKFLQSIKGGKYSFVNGDIVRTSDNMIVGLGRSQDAEGMMGLQSDVTEHLNKSLGIKSRTELLKEMGYPVRPDFNEYFETYTTPKRQINRTRERYKGAQEAYTKAVGIDSELREKWYKEYPTAFEDIDKILEKNSALAREAHAFTDSIDAATEGQMGMFFQWGGHTPEYYAQRSISRSKEIIAEVFETDMVNNRVSAKLFDEYLPDVKKTVLDEIKRRSAQ